MIKTLVNGKPLDEVSVFDRGLSFGDGLFETLAVLDSAPCLWERHLARLVDGCKRLMLPQPDLFTLEQEVQQLLESAGSSILKIIITRGISQRGYAVPDQIEPTRILTLFPWEGPDQSHGELHLTVCRQTLAPSAFAGIKHLNRLEQVMGRAEWHQEFAEGLMCDRSGHVVEGTMSNIFIEKEGRIFTPELNECGVAGVVRGLILDAGEQLGHPVRQTRLRIEDVYAADALYITNSLLGVRRVTHLLDRTWALRAPWHPLMSFAQQHAFDKTQWPC